MPGTQGERGLINARREHRSLCPKFAGLACGLLLGACVAAPPPILVPDPVLSPRDSAALAYDTGRRHALLLHQRRTAVFVSAMPVPSRPPCSSSSD